MVSIGDHELDFHEFHLAVSQLVTMQLYWAVLIVMSKWEMDDHFPQVYDEQMSNKLGLDHQAVFLLHLFFSTFHLSRFSPVAKPIQIVEKIPDGNRRRIAISCPSTPWLLVLLDFHECFTRYGMSWNQRIGSCKGTNSLTEMWHEDWWWCIGGCEKPFKIGYIIYCPIIFMKGSLLTFTIQCNSVEAGPKWCMKLLHIVCHIAISQSSNSKCTVCFLYVLLTQ